MSKYYLICLSVLALRKFSWQSSTKRGSPFLNIRTGLSKHTSFFFFFFFFANSLASAFFFLVVVAVLQQTAIENLLLCAATSQLSYLAYYLHYTKLCPVSQSSLKKCFV